MMASGRSGALDDPYFLKRFAFWRMMFWLVMTVLVVALFFFDRKLWNVLSILYVILISHYANFGTDWGNWQAARAEIQAAEGAETTPDAASAQGHPLPVAPSPSVVE